MNPKLVSIGLTILSATLHAQTFVVNNLDESNTLWLTVSRNLWLASSFTTGSEDATFEAVTAPMGAFNLVDNAFVSLYSNSNSNQPNRRIAALPTSERVPGVGGVGGRRFTPNGDVELDPMTTYWIVFGVNQGGEGGGFNVSYTDSADEESDAGWEIGRAVSGVARSEMVSTWATFGNGAYRFGIEIIPEPQTYALGVGLLLIAFVALRRFANFKTDFQN